MCGIAGIITTDPREAEEAIARMVPAMVHRGPDDAGKAFMPVLLDGQEAVAGFGFRRLAILDLSPGGHQPMVHPDSGDQLIFNGEIYNFQSLRTELEAEGSRFRSTSDTEVLLHALGHWGDAALPRLEGMYALAYYRAADRSVLLARDPLGIKPLYVAKPRGRILFASEIRTLLASKLVSGDLDRAGIAEMLAFGSSQCPRTVFAGIEQFPAGHHEWVGRGRRRFWAFPEVSAERADDAPAAVRTLVLEAVRKHLVADVPVGVFLSAGIDSTIIARCAMDLRADVTAFTVGIGADHPADEVTVAAETARTLGLSHEVLSIDRSSVGGLWRRWIESLDSPSIDGFNTFLVTQALAARGLKVGLSGLGADELFGGYPVFRRGPQLARLASALAWLPRDTAAQAAAAVLRRIGRPVAAEKISSLVADGADLASITIALRRITSDRHLGDLGLSRPRLPATIPAGSDAFNTVSRIEMSHYMRDTLLRDADATSMSHSLEVRVPFLDLPLVEYVSALAGAHKQARGRDGKRLLREAMRGLLPAAVAGRKKTGFVLPIEDWMRGEMRDYCDSAIAACDARGVLARDAVQSVWRDFLRSPCIAWPRVCALVVLGAYLAKSLRA